MVLELKLRDIGNSTGVVLPKEVLARLNVGSGDTVYITETPGGIQVTANNPEFGKLMESAEKMMRKYRNTLHALSK